jgi:hypothetical protein
MSLVVSPSLTFRGDVQLAQMPAKQASGRASSSASIRALVGGFPAQKGFLASVMMVRCSGR